MSDDKCPFCGEPAVRTDVTDSHYRDYRCGTQGPYENGDYTKGHACDITTQARVEAEKDAEIEQLREFAKNIYEAAYTLPWARNAAAKLLGLPSLYHGCEEVSDE